MHVYSLICCIYFINNSASPPAAVVPPLTIRLFDNAQPQFEPVSPDEGDRTPLVDEG